jgi:hypothetical protein
MMFSKTICLVQDAYFPMDAELLLAHAVVDPAKTHVDRFGPFLFESVVGDAGGSAVVGLQGLWRLGMSEFFEDDPDGAGLFAVVEEGWELSFGGAREDFAHDLAQNADGAIGRWQRIGRVGGLVGVFGATAEPAARERAFGAVRWEALLSTHRTMSLATQRTVAAGWVAQQLSSWMTASIVALVPLACWEAMEPMAASIVESIARA